MSFTRLTALIATAFLTLLPISGRADDLALVITNGNYGSGVATRPVTLRHDGIVAAYEEQGYEVISGKNVVAWDFRDLLSSFMDRAEGKDRLVVHFSGRVVNYGLDAWLLPIDVRGDSLPNIAFNAVPVNLLLSLLAERPGRSALVVGLYNGTSFADPVVGGLGDMLNIPQGVLLLSGAEDEVNDVVQLEMLASDASIADILGDKDNLRVEGYVSPDVAFFNPRPEPVEEPIATPEVPAGDDPTAKLAEILAEQALWALAEQSGDIEDYREYIRLYPSGIFSAAARAKIEALDIPEPPTPSEVEDSLNLTRAERREIQSNLTLLGYSTRGVDGIFGSGTRTAVRDWQDDEDLPETGYLDQDQIDLLQVQADNRSIELEQEDRDYWDATGDSGRKADLQLYLNRYPEGIYSDEARAKLRAIEREEREVADREAWSIADELDTANAYRTYLDDFPDGIYAEVAQARLDALEPEEPEDEPEDNEEARSAEQRLNLNSATRLLIEGRLRGLGFNPGTVDGNFDANTRNAIRAYQSSRGIPATGYLNASTVQALLLG